MLSLQNKNRELQNKLRNINLQPKNIVNETEEIEEVIPDNHLNIDMSLEDLVKRNSWFFCEQCDYKTKNKKGLKIHKRKMHYKSEEKSISEKLNVKAFNFKCYCCEHNFKTKKELDDHVIENYDEKQCPWHTF